MRDTMREMLARWERLGDVIQEPWAAGLIRYPRCRNHSPGEPDGFTVVHGNFLHGWRVNPDAPSDLAHIQAAVQEAVEARGWTWSVDGGPTGYAATVITGEEGEAGPMGITDFSAAHALLTAYLAAAEGKRA